VKPLRRAAGELRSLELDGLDEHWVILCPAVALPGDNRPANPVSLCCVRSWQNAMAGRGQGGAVQW